MRVGCLDAVYHVAGQIPLAGFAAEFRDGQIDHGGIVGVTAFGADDQRDQVATSDGHVRQLGGIRSGGNRHRLAAPDRPARQNPVGGPAMACDPPLDAVASLGVGARHLGADADLALNTAAPSGCDGSRGARMHRYAARWQGERADGDRLVGRVAAEPWRVVAAPPADARAARDGVDLFAQQVARCRNLPYRGCGCLASLQQADKEPVFRCQDRSRLQVRREKREAAGPGPDRHDRAVGMFQPGVLRPDGRVQSSAQVE